MLQDMLDRYPDISRAGFPSGPMSAAAQPVLIMNNRKAARYSDMMNTIEDEQQCGAPKKA